MEQNETRAFRWARVLNRTFKPVFGPAQLSPYGEPDRIPVTERACPMCHQVISAHVIEHREGRSTKLHCP